MTAADGRPPWIKPHPPGAICVISRGELANEVCQFVADAIGVSASLGSVVRFHHEYNSSITVSRRIVCSRAIKAGADWVLLLDADQIMPYPDVHLRLLAHNRAIVSALILARRWPFPWLSSRAGAEYADEVAKQRALASLPLSGLVRVDVASAGCLFVGREVFEEVERPWFSVDDHGIAEDYYFVEKARKAGFEAYVDCGLRVGHQVTMSVWPGPDGEVIALWPRLSGVHHTLPTRLSIRPLADTMAEVVDAWPDPVRWQALLANPPRQVTDAPEVFE